MKRNIKFLASALTVAALGVSLSACTDWTEPESLDQNYSAREEVPGYDEYCQKIRNYRQSDHRAVYVWFDNVVNANSHGLRVAGLPDSVDYVVLKNPAKADDVTLSDMAQMRKDFGVKFTYVIDFDAIKSEHTLLVENRNAQIALLDPDAEDYEEQVEKLRAPEFADYMLENLTRQLACAGNFDGVMFGFDGRNSVHMRPAELAEYKTQMLLCLGAARDFANRNKSLVIDYLGDPQNIAGTTFVDIFHTMFIRESQTAGTKDYFSYLFAQATSAGIPAGKIGMIGAGVDPNDPEVGYFADGSKSVDGLMQWALTSEVKNLGISCVAGDYYNPDNIYPHLREFINTVN